MTRDHRLPTARLGSIAAALCLVLPVLAGCAADKTETAAASYPALAHVVAGDLELTNGYIRQPASPDVAAAYLTIANNGSTAATLTAVTSSVTMMVMPMNESDRNGVGRMTDLPSIQIAPHSSFSFTPGRAHLMLEKPKHSLLAGGRVPLTLTFSDAHVIRLDLPVVAPTGP